MIRRREVAKRVFAYELVRSTYQIEDESQPKYVLTPTGERANRIFSVAVLLDKEEIGADTNFWRLRLADPTGTFFATVGRFQPEALEVIGEINVPELIALVGKIRVFEGTSRKLVSIRPEMISAVDLSVRDYWVLETAKRTLERIKIMEERGNEDAELAWRVYNPDLEEYREMVRKAVTTVKEDVEVMERFEEEEEEIDFTGFELEEEEFDLTDLLEE